MTTPVKHVLRQCQQALPSPPRAVDLLQAPNLFPIRHPWSIYLRQQGSGCTSVADQYIIINGAKLFPFPKCSEVQISDISTGPSSLRGTLRAVQFQKQREKAASDHACFYFSWSSQKEMGRSTLEIKHDTLKSTV